MAKRGLTTGAATAIGIGAGAALGIGMGDLGTGLAIGLGGALLATFFGKPAGERNKAPSDDPWEGRRFRDGDARKGRPVTGDLPSGADLAMPDASHSGVRPRFHLAFPVDDLRAARRFYGEVLGCAEGRSSEEWIDFDFFGHQIVAHLSPATRQDHANPVDGHDVPVPHFGLLLRPEEFDELAERLTAAGTDFVIAPCTRFKGQPGEQSTMFLRDPAGNALEFKAFADERMIFATDTIT